MFLRIIFLIFLFTMSSSFANEANIVGAQRLEQRTIRDLVRQGVIMRLADAYSGLYPECRNSRICFDNYQMVKVDVVKAISGQHYYVIQILNKNKNPASIETKVVLADIQAVETERYEEVQNEQ